MAKVAARNKWIDDEVTYRAGGYEREPPNWLSLSGVDTRKKKQEEQSELYEKNKDRTHEIHRRMREGESLKGV